MVLGVLRQIAMSPRVGDLLNNAVPLELLAVLEFRCKRCIARGSHRNLVHWSQTSKLAESNSQRGLERYPATRPQACLYLTVADLIASIRLGREIALQRVHLEVAFEIGLDALRCGDGPRESGVVRHFMQEGRAPKRPAVGQGCGPLGGVENEMDLAVLDGVNDMGAPFGDLVDLDRRHA